MEGQKQLPAQEVKKGREIASWSIHVELAIGWKMIYGILKGTMPISLSQTAKQIVDC